MTVLHTPLRGVAIFIKVLSKVLRPEILEFTTTYADDLLIASKDCDTHCKHLD